MAPRWILALTLASVSLAWQADPPKSQPGQGELKKQRPQPQASTKEQDPPEEDASIAPTEYSFNPLQAEKDLRVGNFYWKQGKIRAAAGRFREATKWNEGFGEAWLRLGEAEEKLKDRKAAREAYTKYLELAADAKNASEIRKRISKLQ